MRVIISGCVGHPTQAVSRQWIIVQIEQESFSFFAPKVRTIFFELFYQSNVISDSWAEGVAELKWHSFMYQCGTIMINK